MFTNYNFLREDVFPMPMAMPPVSVGQTGAAMLSGLSGVGLVLNKSVFQVGDKPIYHITGGIPGSAIAWTSYHNGESTGEYQAAYGDHLDANGEATLPAAQAWSAADIGSWRKDVVLIPPDYPARAVENATVSFTVVSPSTAPAPTPLPPGPIATGGGLTDFFSGSITLPLVGDVPTPVVIGGGVILLLMLSGGGGRR